MPASESNSEWLTRKRRIDPLLDAVGWPRSNRSLPGAYRLEEYETDNGPADYALCEGFCVLGIIEAKKLSLGPQNVLIQAERYSRGARHNHLDYRGYQKALVDLISMAKHAAKDQEPLLTAPERLARTFTKLTAGRLFTPEQEQWLARIREHLVANLSIDQDDFENIPVLEQAGGWRKSNSVFSGKLVVF